MIAKTVGIEVAPEFPVEIYNEIHAKIGPLQPRYVEEFRHYAGAWNAVAIRYRTAAEADKTFRESLGNPQTPDERYVQERAFFEFFANLYSSLESFAYGLYALGAMINPHHFPLTASALRNISPARTANLFATHFPSESLGTAIRSTMDDPKALELKELRNALSHRASSTRTCEMPAPAGPGSEVSWRIDHLKLKAGMQSLTIDSNTTSQYRNWLGAQLQNLLVPTKHLVSAYF